MDFLNQSFAQLKDLFEGMTPGSRITAGLLLVVVVVSLAYLFTHAVPGGDAYLFEGRSFANSELDAMGAALGAAGFDYETDGTRIRVPRGKKYEYMGALAKAGALPKDFGDILKSTLENESFFASGKLTEERIKAAMQQEYSRIIAKLGGVSRASVVYASHIKPGFLQEEVVTATVNVDMLGSKAVDQKLADAICSTIMGGVGGVTPENIRVVDNATGFTFRGNSEDLAGDAGGSLATDTQVWEKSYRDKILDSLRDIRGVTVRCNVQLSQEKHRIEESIDRDPKTIALQMNEKTLTRSFEGAEPAGRPGTVGQTNAPRALGNSQGKGSKEDTDESELEQTNIAVKSTQTKTESMGRRPERVTASITVPRSHFEDIWHQMNDKPDEEPKPPSDPDLEPLIQAELSQIKTSVAALIPKVQGVDDLTELVQVRVSRPIAMEPIPDPGIAESALTWLGQSWQTLGLIGLAFFSLLMIRSMVKSAPGAGIAEAPAAGSGSESRSAEEDQSAQQSDAPQLVRFGTSGKSLKDELSDLVAEDPDAAANVLKNWIGHVSNAA